MAVLRALPQVTVFAPGDPAEVEAVVPVMMQTPGTCYLRLGRGGEPTLHPAPIENYQLGQGLTLRQGRDIALLSAGGILSQTVSAANMLAEKGIEAEVVSFPTLKPIDRELILSLGKRFPWLICAEEHTVIGGLGSAVCEVLAEEGATCRVCRMGMPDIYSSIVGTQQYLRSRYGMDDVAIARRAEELVKHAEEARP